MTIALDPELEKTLNELARQQGTDAQTLALNALREKFLLRSKFVPRDEWERRLLQIGSPCGISPPDSAFSREELYE